MNPFVITKDNRKKKHTKKGQEEETNLVFKGSYDPKHKVFNITCNYPTKFYRKT